MKWKKPQMVKPSTRAWIREARQIPSYSLFDLLHGYIYARFPYFYIGVGTGEHRLSRWLAPLASRVITLLVPGKFRQTENVSPEAVPPGALPGVTPGGLQFANTYHGKVVPLEAAKQLVSIRKEIRIEDLETVIPYDRARALILNHPDHIVALDCPCRVARANPCLPLDVCLIIGEPFAGFIAEHQPKRSRWITSEEAIDILKAEDERGHVHHAFFKDAMLGRFYAICNCCECCCGAMQAHRTGTPMLTASGYRASVNQELCLACGTCVDICPFHALSLQSNGTFHAQVDPQRCMGCGVCVGQCPQGGIALQVEPANGVPLDIR